MYLINGILKSTLDHILCLIFFSNFSCNCHCIPWLHFLDNLFILVLIFQTLSFPSAKLDNKQRKVMKIFANFLIL